MERAAVAFGARRLVLALALVALAGCRLPTVGFRGDASAASDAFDAVSGDGPGDAALEAAFDAYGDAASEGAVDAGDAADAGEALDVTADVPMLDGALDGSDDARVDALREGAVEGGACVPSRGACGDLLDAGPIALGCDRALAMDSANCGAAGVRCESGQECVRCACAAVPVASFVLAVRDDEASDPSDEIQSTVFGLAGELYVAGVFDHVLQLGETQLPVGARRAGAVVWIARIDRDGSVAWARELADATHTTRVQVEVDRAGDVLVASTSRAGIGVRLEADPLPTPPVVDSVFVAALAPSGAPRWVRQFGSTRAELFERFALRSDGAMVLASRVPFAGVAGDRDNLVLRAVTAQSGCPLWTLEGAQQPFGLCPDGWTQPSLRVTGLRESEGGAVLVSGWSCRDIEVGCGRVTVFEPLSGFASVGSFVARVERDGRTGWVRSLVPQPNLGSGVYAQVLLQGLAVDASGAAYLVGEHGVPFAAFSSATAWGVRRTPGNPMDIFRARVEPDGALTWLISSGYGDNDQARAVAADLYGSHAAVFSSGGSTTTTGGFGGTLPAPGAAYVRGALVAYDVMGRFRWGHVLQAPTARGNEPGMSFTDMAMARDGALAVAASLRPDGSGGVAYELRVDGASVLPAGTQPVVSFVGVFR